MGETGVVKSIGRITDEDGKTVLQAIVNFYDGDCPDITFGTVWGREPVKIVVVDRPHSSEERQK